MLTLREWVKQKRGSGYLGQGHQDLLRDSTKQIKKSGKDIHASDDTYYLAFAGKVLVIKMNKSEIIGELNRLGKIVNLPINLTTRSIQNYANEGLMPRPVYPRKGQGANAEFPEWAAAEAFASYCLMHAITTKLGHNNIVKNIIKQAREIALYWENVRYQSLGDVLNDTKMRDLVHNRAPETSVSFNWLSLKHSALLGEPISDLIDPGLKAIILGLAEKDDFIDALWSGDFKEIRLLSKRGKGEAKEQRRQKYINRNK